MWGSREFPRGGPIFPMSPSGHKITIRDAANEDKYGDVMALIVGKDQGLIPDGLTLAHRQESR
ncbi:hypothetical protein BDM02DRAFT_381038 [Thelephora ganbajun]|uniref:Uncharacterized protein n=1 Tax=Thelephora ganbajun TaxID=370292 RepID=A0ACB6Z9X4_THEGA|nr:hypothetical protein BDM02DRAFT_381038 [Thelephora ganbajun]